MTGGRMCTGAARNDWARRVRARRASRKRQQCDVARPLDGFAEPALMARAHAGHTPRQNFAALLHELRQDVGALVVDEVHLLDAELANFFLAKILALAATRTAWATGTAAWSTLTAWTTMAASRSAVPRRTALAARTARTLRLFLFFCHTCLPF